MNNRVFIEGNVIVDNCRFYARNFIILASDSEKKDAEVISCKDGRLILKEDYGSIFVDYYISGNLSFINGGNGLFFEYNYDDTYAQYTKNVKSIKSMIDNVIPPKDQETLFFQQQYISAIGALELFLYNTLMWRVCGDKYKYDRVISSRLNKLTKNKDVVAVLKGKDCLKKEKQFISSVQNIVYHRKEQVTPLFKTAFKTDPLLGQLISEIKIRHNLVHRMGFTVYNEIESITKEQVLSLIDKINSIVENITSKCSAKNS